jgi:hypothetical protein
MHGPHRLAGRWRSERPRADGRSERFTAKSDHAFGPRRFDPPSRGYRANVEHGRSLEWTILERLTGERSRR